MVGRQFIFVTSCLSTCLYSMLCFAQIESQQVILQASFLPLGTLNGCESMSTATAVSSDGRFVVGSSVSPQSCNNPPAFWIIGGIHPVGWEAVRWEVIGEQIRAEGLGDLPGDDYFHSFATDVSADGSRVVGGSWSGNSLRRDRVIPGTEGFLWENGEMLGLGVLPNRVQQSSTATAISADGRFITGQVSYPEGSYQAYHWGEETWSLTPLGNIPGPANFGGGRFITSSGTKVIGTDSAYANNEIGNCIKPTLSSEDRNAWTTEVLGQDCGAVYDVAKTKDVLVGYLRDSNSFQAARWTRSNGSEFLDKHPRVFRESIAYSVSSDGGVVVGYGVLAESGQGSQGQLFSGWLGGSRLWNFALGKYENSLLSAPFSESEDFLFDSHPVQAFVWDEVHGLRLLREIVEDEYLLDLRGWNLSIARDVSDDGRIMVGTGLNRLGETEGFRVELALDPRLK